MIGTLFANIVNIIVINNGSVMDFTLFLSNITNVTAEIKILIIASKIFSLRIVRKSIAVIQA